MIREIIRSGSEDRASWVRELQAASCMPTVTPATISTAQDGAETRPPDIALSRDAFLLFESKLQNENLLVVLREAQCYYYE
jgi:hypothetical protein